MDDNGDCDTNTWVGNTFEETVAAVVATIRDAEARAAAAEVGA